jgi:hypothetical protein
MSIDFETDHLEPVASLFERRAGFRPSRPTLWRWRNKGVRGARLDMVLIGNKWFSTSAAVGEFLRAQTAKGLADPRGPHAGRVIAAANAKRRKATAAKLKKAGLLK